jgi:antitoxin VapB
VLRFESVVVVQPASIDQGHAARAVLASTFSEPLPTTSSASSVSLSRASLMARVGKNNRAQVVTIPLEFRFPEGMKEVFIRKVGDDVVLSPRPVDWSRFLASDLRVSDDFIANLEDLPGKANRIAVDALMRHLTVMDWSRDAAEHHAEIRADLKRKSQLIGSNDLLIGAHARSLGAVVDTNNVKDFRRVKELEVENWMV